MLGLKTQCIHPETGAPYIKSSVGGKDNSPERASVNNQPQPSLSAPSFCAFANSIRPQGGYTHGFVVEFENDQDREYYLKGDPAHREFVRSLSDVIQSAGIVDFNPGVY